MNQAEILLAVIEGAKVGPAVAPEEALSLLASVIERLDKASDSYERNVGDLFSVGACIWQMQGE